jgi:hypothetical protein
VSAARAGEHGTTAPVSSPDAGPAQPQPDNPGDREDEFWAGATAELTEEEINRIDLDRERAEAEAIEDESRPVGPLWDADKGEAYDDATAAMLIAEARHAEYRERENSCYPYFHREAAADSGAWQAQRDGADTEREAGQ